MNEPATAAAWQSLVKLWERGSRLLWTLTAAVAAASAGLALAAYSGFGPAEKLLVDYGICLIVALPALLVFSVSKTLEERAAIERRRPIALIPNEQQSHWSQAVQQSGELFTAIALRFQVTNVSDGDVRLSAIELCRPRTSRHRIRQTLLAVRHPTGNLYSFDYPILAHQLTQGSAHLTIVGAVGRAGDPMKISVRIQDHAERWYKMSFPMVRFVGPVPQAE
jgi:hypothetical protein